MIFKQIYNKEKELPIYIESSSVVQRKGLEPSWYCYHTDLNRARLPIPPSLQGSYYYNIIAYVCQVIF